jgi:hypothetical protein
VAQWQAAKDAYLSSVRVSSGDDFQFDFDFDYEEDE